ncbi:hypothetical protein ACFV9C_42015 [Kribbella sp. NPDC059898]|uniref:hypothetical protein n=1 Tax=Kribbella sp. NPDC059898 TaxID=3346995 RepID=UPI00365336B5
MSDLVFNIVSALLALVAIVVAARATRHAKRQADAAEAAQAVAATSNEIARKALAEAAAVRELAHREWHGNATPGLTVRLGEGRAEPGGYELIVETDKDLDSCVLELAEGTEPTEVAGLSAGLTEAMFGHNPEVNLRTMKAGTPKRPAIWLTPTADGVTVYLRCTVTIGEETWGPIVHEIKIPAPARVHNPAKSRRRIER